MTRAAHDPGEFLPLSAQEFQVLMVLAGGTPLHGYGIMQAAESQSGREGVLELGSLYRIISRMLDSGLLADADPPRDEVPSAGRPRRYYRITELGTRVALLEAARLRSILTSEAAARLLGQGKVD